MILADDCFTTKKPTKKTRFGVSSITLIRLGKNRKGWIYISGETSSVRVHDTVIAHYYSLNNRSSDKTTTRFYVSHYVQIKIGQDYGGKGRTSSTISAGRSLNKV